MEGPCYGRVNAWCSGSYESKLRNELDYMEKVGCNGYMIELCAHTAANEPKRWNNDPEEQTQAWLREVEEKYNKFLDLIKKHKKMWALVSVFNDNAWQREVGPDSGTTDRIIDIVKNAGHKDMICILPVGEPSSSTGKSVIPKVHRELKGFKLLKEHYGDESTDYWNWYTSDQRTANNKKQLESSDGHDPIQTMCGYGSLEWVPEFPHLSGDPEAEEASYDYRGDTAATVNWVRNRINVPRNIAVAYYAWGYDGNYNGAEAAGDKDSFGSGKIDAYAICGTVVGCDKSIPSGQMVAKVNALISEYGIPNL